MSLFTKVIFGLVSCLAIGCKPDNRAAVESVSSTLSDNETQQMERFECSGFDKDIKLSVAGDGEVGTKPPMVAVIQLAPNMSPVDFPIPIADVVNFVSDQKMLVVNAKRSVTSVSNFLDLSYDKATGKGSIKLNQGDSQSYSGEGAIITKCEFSQYTVKKIKRENTLLMLRSGRYSKLIGDKVEIEVSDVGNGKATLNISKFSPMTLSSNSDGEWITSKGDCQIKITPTTGVQNVSSGVYIYQSGDCSSFKAVDSNAILDLMGPFRLVSAN